MRNPVLALALCSLGIAMVNPLISRAGEITDLSASGSFDAQVTPTGSPPSNDQTVIGLSGSGAAAATLGESSADASGSWGLDADAGVFSGQIYYSLYAPTISDFADGSSYIFFSFYTNTTISYSFTESLLNGTYSVYAPYIQMDDEYSLNNGSTGSLAPGAHTFEISLGCDCYSGDDSVSGGSDFALTLSGAPIVLASPVPLPGALSLMMTGLGALGVAITRRRKPVHSSGVLRRVVKA